MLPVKLVPPYTRNELLTEGVCCQPCVCLAEVLWPLRRGARKEAQTTCNLFHHSTAVVVDLVPKRLAPHMLVTRGLHSRHGKDSQGKWHDYELYVYVVAHCVCGAQSKKAMTTTSAAQLTYGCAGNVSRHSGYKALANI